MSTPAEEPPRILITAGPTHEPIDAVRYIGNRSSGRLGVGLADAAARRGWRVTLLLGPTALTPFDSRVTLYRFRTAEDLAGLLEREFPGPPGAEADVLVMAAAVADYRPAEAALDTKRRRSEGGLTLRLVATPDLLAACSGRRRAGQLLVGFALEPRDRLLASAREKAGRKGLDLIVANPLETMDAPTIEAVLLDGGGAEVGRVEPMAKAAFGAWLLDQIERRIGDRAGERIGRQTVPPGAEARSGTGPGLSSPDAEPR